MSTRPLRFLTTATLLLLIGMLTSCNQLFFAEVSLPQLCVTLDSQQFDGQDGDYHADVTFGPQSIDVSSYLSALPKDDAEIQLRVLTGHTSTVRCMALHGLMLVSGSRDASLRVWNIGERTPRFLVWQYW